MESKRNEKCGWGCFFQSSWRVCKWSETLRVASGWAWGWIGTLHLGHMCLQRGQEKQGWRAKTSLCVSFFPLSELKKKTFERLSCRCHKSASTPKSNLAVEFLNSSPGNELGEHNKITIKFVYKTVLSTCWIGQRSLQSPDFSAVECVWWCEGHANQQQIHKITKRRK